MVQAKKHWVKLSLPKSFLENLPDFPPPVSKSRQKKGPVNDDKKTGMQATSKGSGKNASKNGSKSVSKGLSPAPTGEISSAKINTGPKEMSTAGLTVNSASSEKYALDKTSRVSKKWVKRQAQFKTFTGFKIKYVTWKQKD